MLSCILAIKAVIRFSSTALAAVVKGELTSNADQIYAFIDLLPPASAQVFNLYFIDGFKHREIADMLDISEGTSKWHLNAAREKLKKMLQEIEVPFKIAVNE